MNGFSLPGEPERFRSVITQRLGLQFEDAKLGFLGEVLRRRLTVLKQPSDAYLRSLQTAPLNGELSMLAQELTVGETYFFRNNEQFQALAQVALPERARIRAASKTLRLLSAGCASGEEAYSMAIVSHDTIVDPSWDVHIRAVDLNPVVLEKARRARFSVWALRETSPDLQHRWFRPDGREMILEESARAAVRFDQKNLVADDVELWEPAAYDVIFCRNVMMYFSPEQASTVIARVARSLAPGGYLFLGHAETLRGLSDDFHLRHTHGTFYYERKEGAGADFPRPAHAAPRLTSAALSITTFSEAWVDAIREASDRVEALVPAHHSANRSVAPLRPAWDLARALDLLHSERFAEALAYVRELPPESDGDPDALLLKAMLLAHGGELAAAEAVCRRLLSIEELNAGAHYALALCRESLRDRAGAVEHDRVAVYLDPAFAMPRLHLGLLARHAGDRAAARRELGQALVLLKREDATRLLLFGGGFNRDALIALCRSALRDCGGQS
jgi:chemotaxis protein methyltransferase CheR